MAKTDEDKGEYKGSEPIRTITNEELERVLNNFTHHTPFGSQELRYGTVRGQARAFAIHIIERCPPSRELSLALTKLEEAVFWANAAIARNETNVANP